MGIYKSSVDDLVAELECVLRCHPEGLQLACVSGFFDVLHDGHLELLERASYHGRLIVIVNGDEATERKKGYVQLPAVIRAKVVAAIKWVHYSVVYDGDNVGEALAKIQPNCFIQGGDRASPDTWDEDEIEACRRHGIVQFAVKGEKVQSSSSLFRRAVAQYNAHNA